MELMVAAIVGSTALDYHSKVPTTSWMRLMRAGDMAGEVSFSSICIFDPYWIYVPFDCRDVMELMVAAIVGSNALEYHSKVPTTSWIRLMCSGDMAGEVYLSSIYIFEPYFIGPDFAGACCGCLGLACWYLCRALGTKFGM